MKKGFGPRKAQWKYSKELKKLKVKVKKKTRGK